MMETVSRVKEDELEDLNLGSAKIPKMVRISAHLDNDSRQELKKLLQEFIDVFAWDYYEMKGMDPIIHIHRISLKEDAIPIQLQCYRMNLNYARQVKDELEKLLKVGYIKPVDQAAWLSPTVMVPKTECNYNHGSFSITLCGYISG